MLALLSVALIIATPPDCPTDSPWAFQQERKRMVNRQIVARGITDAAVLRAMCAVPRHKFVSGFPPEVAYRDRPLPIEHDQTISQPYIVAHMTALVEPDSTDRALEIGTGSGYQAAVLAEIVDSVYTVEIIPELAQRATRRLGQLGYNNVRVKAGDGYQGWGAHAPYDVIVVTAAPEEIPPPLIQQLKEGGRMVIPVGPSEQAQQLMLVTKENGQIRRQRLTPVRFVPFLDDP